MDIAGDQNDKNALAWVSSLVPDAQRCRADHQRSQRLGRNCLRGQLSMATSPSAAFLRLRAFIAERMGMSPIDQPLMLLELLGRRSPAPAQDVARRILGSEELNDVESQGLAVASERTAIRS